MKALMIKDLSASHELDRQAMSAVRGGSGDQANGVSQMNVQSMSALGTVGSASMLGGPANIQSNNTFTQVAQNHSSAANLSGFSIGYPLFGSVATL